jgi:hypothetical protein
MNNYPDAFDQMLAAWNEPDPAKIRGHLEAALNNDVRFVDPTIDIVGIDDFESMVHDVQARIPGAVYSRISKVDAHHNVYRYHWAIHSQGKLLVQGFDVIEAKNDKISKVIGFFGDLALNDSTL